MTSFYHLTLADGNEWNLTADSQTEDWLRNFAEICHLKPSDQRIVTTIVFTRGSLCQRDSAEIFTPYLNRIRAEILNGEWFSVEQRMFRIWSKPCSNDLVIDIGSGGDSEMETLRMWQALLPIYETSLASGAITLHGALIEKGGKAFALAGPGNVGKSTCARRLQPPWRALCDDEILVVKGVDGLYYAHPFPTWSDYLWRKSSNTWQIEQYFPLSAIFFIMKGEEDCADRLGTGQAAVLIQQSSEQVFEKGWHFLHKSKVVPRRIMLFCNITKLIKQVPAYTLKVNLNGRFWEEIERASNGSK